MNRSRSFAWLIACVTLFAVYIDVVAPARVPLQTTNGSQPQGGNQGLPNGGLYGLKECATDGWCRSQTSYFGAPDYFSQAYIERGKGAFGDPWWGSCGYTSYQPGGPTTQGSQKAPDGLTIPVPMDGYAAISDQDPDYPGSCGRCYEFRCVEGLVRGYQDQPVPYEVLYYAPKVNPNVKDEQGRSFPGNPAEAQGDVYVKCWDPNKTVRVKIIDTCPCYYQPAGSPVYMQHSCCWNKTTHPKGGQLGFDISFWAFQQLAHPLYGAMMTDFRPVDCDTGAPLPLLPGYISKDVLYSEGVAVGWNWFHYDCEDYEFAVKGAGKDGSEAACATAKPGGGMAFLCRNCSQSGYQPFAGKNTLSFWISSNTSGADSTGIPNLKLSLSAFEDKKYCGSEPYLSQLKPSDKQGNNLLEFDVPLSSFNCQGAGLDQSLVDKVDWINVNSAGDIRFCLDEVRLS